MTELDDALVRLVNGATGVVQAAAPFMHSDNGELAAAIVALRDALLAMEKALET